MVLRRAYGQFGEFLKRQPIFANMLTYTVVLGVADVGGQQLEKYLKRFDPDDDDDKSKLVARNDVKSYECTIDWNRTARIAACGFFVSGPIKAGWFWIAERIVPATLTGGRAVAYKVAATQILQQPVYTSSIFAWVQCWGVYDASVKSQDSAKHIDSTSDHVSSSSQSGGGDDNNSSDKSRSRVKKFGQAELVESWRRIKIKCNQDLLKTILGVSCFWVPFHVVTFTFIPIHWRVPWTSLGSMISTTFQVIMGHRTIKKKVEPGTLERGTGETNLLQSNQ